jgi:folate-binding protein YgfZ
MLNVITNETQSTKTLAIAVAGIDAVKLLQGQLTCDVAALADGQTTLGAYCNIKGKVESLFKLSRAGDVFYIVTNPDLLNSTLQELKKYAVFSKVTLEIQEISIPTSDEVAEIMAKIPALYPQTVGEFFPHDLNLPALGAVSFTKGCYRGQEIVARMQHRGNLKRGLYIFNATQLTQPGSKIMAAENIAGTIVRCAATTDGRFAGLAVITDSYITEQLKIAELPITVTH